MLTGCSTPLPSTEYRLWTPPANLLADCPVTEWAGGTWADVVDLAESRKADLADCNADKAALRSSVEAAKAAWGR